GSPPDACFLMNNATEYSPSNKMMQTDVGFASTADHPSR
ncbi:MAG: hypothetical protein ACI82F_002832, partial [Planctomycetota bacterium]